MAGILDTIRRNPGTNFSLADVFLFAQIPSPFAAVPAVLIAGYVFLRSLASGKIAAVLDRLEQPVAKAFLRVQDKIPFLRKIAPGEFAKGKPGSTLLVVGVAQFPIFLASLAIAALNPAVAVGWLAAGAAGLFCGGNIKLGLQLNDSSRIKSTLSWKDLVASPQFLVAAGSCCSGVMAGLVTSFGVLAVAPIAVSLAAAALICTGKIGKVHLNPGVPMGALTLSAALNTVVGIVNGNWLAALANAFSANGERILTGFFNDEYKKTRAQEDTASTGLVNWTGQIFHREAPMRQLRSPAPAPVSTTPALQFSAADFDKSAALSVAEKTPLVQQFSDARGRQARIEQRAKELHLVLPTASSMRPA